MGCWDQLTNLRKIYPEKWFIFSTKGSPENFEILPVLTGSILQTEKVILFNFHDINVYAFSV